MPPEIAPFARAPDFFCPTVHVRVTHEWEQVIVAGLITGAKKVFTWQRLWMTRSGKGHGIWIDMPVEELEMPDVADMADMEVLD